MTLCYGQHVFAYNQEQNDFCKHIYFISRPTRLLVERAADCTLSHLLTTRTTWLLTNLDLSILCLTFWPPGPPGTFSQPSSSSSSSTSSLVFTTFLLCVSFFSFLSSLFFFSSPPTVGALQTNIIIIS